jgi:RNA polymerase sigma-70 factor (ECF subfamily)
MANSTLDAIAAGDGAALAGVYDGYAPRLHAVARRLLPVAADAEECVQEVFVSLVENSRRMREVADLGAWLFASLRHAVIARSKKNQRTLALHAFAAPAEASSQTDPAQARALTLALEKLPAEQREVVALKVDGGLTFAEIGALLGMSLNTAASRYRYALAKLREELLP